MGAGQRAAAPAAGCRGARQSMVIAAAAGRASGGAGGAGRGGLRLAASNVCAGAAAAAAASKRAERRRRGRRGRPRVTSRAPDCQSTRGGAWGAPELMCFTAFLRPGECGGAGRAGGAARTCGAGAWGAVAFWVWVGARGVLLARARAHAARGSRTRTRARGSAPRGRQAARGRVGRLQSWSRAVQGAHRRSRSARSEGRPRGGRAHGSATTMCRGPPGATSNDPRRVAPPPSSTSNAYRP